MKESILNVLSRENPFLLKACSNHPYYESSISVDDSLDDIWNLYKFLRVDFYQLVIQTNQKLSFSASLSERLSKDRFQIIQLVEEIESEYFRWKEEYIKFCFAFFQGATKFNFTL